MPYYSQLLIFAFNYLGITISAIIGTKIMEKRAQRQRFLSLWMLGGVIASLSIIVIQDADPIPLSLVSLVLGVSFGLGVPICLSLFADSTTTQNRGLSAGIAYFAVGIGTFIIGMLVNIFNFAAIVLTFVIWRGLGLFFFLMLRPKEETRRVTIPDSYKTIFAKRSFLLYFFPWVLFCLINYFETPILLNLSAFFLIVPITEFGIGGVTALIGGYFADIIGRKRIIIFGYVSLGVGYAILGLFSTANISWYFYLLADGIAWGIFALMFFLIIWGELAENQPKEKYYLVGLLPFPISSYIELLIRPYVGTVPISAAFSLASLFLFLAVLALLYAPETLPEKRMREKELKSYIEKAKRVKEKFT